MLHSKCDSFQTGRIPHSGFSALRLAGQRDGKREAAVLCEILASSPEEGESKSERVKKI